MKFCRSGSHVLLLLILTIEFVSAFTPVVKVEYEGTAILPCTEKCSGVISWTVFYERFGVLVVCDQNSCRSVKEGYQMIHDQYLKGDFSLIITEANFRKRGYYTCECDGKDLCDVYLQIEAQRTQILIKSGDSLLMKLGEVGSDTLGVIYGRTEADGSSGRICAVVGGPLQCKPEYKHRTSRSSSILELRDMKKSDSGVYTIRNIRNNEDIYIYTITVTDTDSSLFSFEGVKLLEWLPTLLVALLVAAVVVIIGVACCNVQQRREIQRLRRTARRNGEDNKDGIHMSELT